MNKRVLTRQFYFFAGLFMLFFVIPGALASEKEISTDILIVYSGDMMGNVEPAGCCSGIGGITRTATVIQQLKKEHPHVMVIDSGDFLWNWEWNRSWNQTMESLHPVETDTMYRAMKMISYDALNIADGEILSGTAFLNTFGSDADLPMTSLNVRLPETGPVQPKPYIIKQFDNVRIAVVGLTLPDLVHEKADDGFQVADPFETLEQKIQEIRDQADVIILMAHLRWDNIQRLIEQVADIDIVISGHETYPTFEPEKAGKTLIVKTARSGGVIGTIRLERDKKTGEINAITSDLMLIEEDKITPLPEFAEIESGFKAEKLKIRSALLRQQSREKQLNEAEDLFKKMDEEFSKFIQE